MANLLLDIEVIGVENFPKHGPYIVVGNHVSSLEPILMLIVTPQQLEFVGTGDIPIDPRMSFFTDLYQFIPIMRGQIDQKGLSLALNVLEQDGALGIFPEGGIWDKNLKDPKIGTSWISYKSKAPVIPIGFIGMNGSLLKALTLKKPKVKINIGEMIEFETIFPEGTPLKQTMQAGARKIMEKISSLLPEDEITNPNQYQPKELKIFLVNRDDEKSIITFENQESFSKLIDHPVIMDVFKRNLKLPVNSLLIRDNEIPLIEVKQGIAAILNYLSQNSGFLSYRFGMDESIRMTNGLRNINQIILDYEAEWGYLIIQE